MAFRARHSEGSHFGRMGEVPSGLCAASCTWGMGRVHRELGTCVSEVPGLGAQRSFLILGEEL